MTGHVLIVDALAINRIVLKAALSAAFYVVKQASTAGEAIEVCTKETPDVILIGGDLPDMSASDLIRRFDTLCSAPVPPVMILLTANNPQARVAALQAGASDVLAHPLDEDELFARLRALLRQRRLDSDLVMHAKTANALGLSEDPVAFSGPERAAILSADETTAKAICARLTPFCDYQLVPGSHHKADQILSGRAKPDVTLLHIDDDTEAGLRRLASLQAGSDGRDMRVIALTAAETSGQAAKLLDMGASDVLHLHGDGGPEDQECAFRLSQQIARKKQSDTLRRHLESGLQAAVIDPLTGLHNRRYAQVYLRRMIDDARAKRQRCAVMIADLDYFKSVNDTFGHAAGDRVLIR
ncbi:MAG: response regulator, partial [Pseudomonadota bacterium]